MYSVYQYVLYMCTIVYTDDVYQWAHVGTFSVQVKN